MQKNAPVAGDTIATITTSEGQMRFKLFGDLIEEGVQNFSELAKEEKYDGSTFHRIIAGFMIQGGDFQNGNGTGGYSFRGPGTTIGDQYHPELKHIRGALSYAKTAMPNSIGSQFFIMHDTIPQLDHPKNGGPAEGYTVFGQLFEGEDVLDRIAAVDTNYQDAPLEPVLIESIRISEFE